MSTSFSDHFATVARQYADCRPTYPAALFDWVAGQCNERALAWDCGAGNGQASVELARHFQKVIATDASAAQIEQATLHPQIDYRVASAEESSLEDHSADLVIVAQAMHWFDLERFHAEVRRVLKPGGIIAVWSYGVQHVEDEEINAIVQHFYAEEIGLYWPPERRHVENGYSELPFPYTHMPAPIFAMQLSWNLEQLLGYFRSWSATAAYVKANGRDPVAELAPRLAACWGDPTQVRMVTWPLTLLVGRCD